MTLRPVDTDLLAEICRSIALEHSGFLYVDSVKDAIQSEYENSEKSLLAAGSLSSSDIKDALQDIAASDGSSDLELERVRNGVYYYDPFGQGSGEGVTGQLTRLFRQQLVVTSERLRSWFDLAIDDVDYFAGELEQRKLVRRIATGERDYFTIGPRLQEQTGEAGVDQRLTEEATNGKISHDQLEKVINVAATADVIRYLEGQGFVTDLDGEYLVDSAIDEFGAHLAAEVGDAVEAEFESWSYVLPESEFEQVVQTEVEERTDALAHAGSSRAEILDATEAALESRLGLERDASMVVQREAFESLLDRRAEEVRAEVSESGEHLAAESDIIEAGVERVEELQPTTSGSANEYVRGELADRYRALVESEFTVE